MKIIIIGTSPTGVAASPLQELVYFNWIYDKSSYAGDLAASFRSDNGFTWNIMGHVPRYNHMGKLGIEHEI